MGINVNSLSPTEAKGYWYDYNNGNKNGLSEAEYQSICTKFRSYIDNWENDVDENGYTTEASPQDRLDYDADDAGFFGSDGKGAQGISNVAVAGAAGVANAAVATTGTSGFMGGVTEAMTVKTGALEGLQGMLLVAAALQFAMAMVTKANSPNEDAVEACLTAQDELYTEQANLAEQVLTMEEMQEEMEMLQEQALAKNEEGQGEIADLEGLYNYYYTKYQNGTATEKDIALMKALGAQMSSTQAITNEETLGLNEEIVAVGDGFEEITSNIEASNDFTNYVSEIDNATKNSSIAQGTILTISAASAAVTTVQCLMRANVLTGSFILSWLAAAYIAAAALAGTAAGIFGTEAAKQLGEYRSTAEDTIDLRKNTQDLSAETTEYQEVSTEYWEETVDTTSGENLFTLTPTYANVTTSTQTNNTSETSPTNEATPDIKNETTPTTQKGTSTPEDKDKDDK